MTIIKPFIAVKPYEPHEIFGPYSPWPKVRSDTKGIGQIDPKQGAKNAGTVRTMGSIDDVGQVHM